MASEEAGERGAHWEEWGSGRPTCARGACTLVGPRAAPAAAGWSVLFQEWSNAGGVVACSACPRRSRPVNATSVGSAVCHRLPDGDRIPYQSVLFALFSLCSRPALLGRETLALHPLSPTPAPTCSLPPAPECSHSRSSWPRSSSSSPPPLLQWCRTNRQAVPAKLHGLSRPHKGGVIIIGEHREVHRRLLDCVVQAALAPVARERLAAR